MIWKQFWIGVFCLVVGTALLVIGLVVGNSIGTIYVVMGVIFLGGGGAGIVLAIKDYDIAEEAIDRARN